MLLTSNLCSTKAFQVQNTSQSVTMICSMSTITLKTRSLTKSTQLLEVPSGRTLTHDQLKPAIDYVHTHIGEDLSLVQIAKVINISPTYFASLFKFTTGISPHQYVIKQRVNRAKLLLLTTDLSIADIALKVGFSSQSHLTQHFKRLTRMTPKKFAIYIKS